MTKLFNLDGFNLNGEPTKFTHATGPVIIRDNKIMLHKAPSTEKYQFIGGRLDDGVSPKQNAINKAKQDLNLEVRIINDTPLPIVGQITRDGKPEQIVLLHYLAEIIEEPENKEYEWFTLEQIEEMTEKGEVSSPNILIASRYFLKK
jgi:ADP-ribose pyrophosphatase YjhB (NUDIX family)